MSQSFTRIEVQREGTAWGYTTQLKQLKFCGLEKMRAVAAEFSKAYSSNDDTCGVHDCSDTQCVNIWSWTKEIGHERFHFRGVADEHLAMAERFGQWMWSQRV